MDKYSVIIPTLWKSNRTKQLLSDLNDCEYVDEIIVINNQLTDVLDVKVEKVRHISFGKNIYVNPAWNKGIELAKNECVALCNDDINFDTNIFSLITKEILNKAGIIGMGEGNYGEHIDKSTPPFIQMWRPGINDWGWGCLIFLNKKDWEPIPNNIKIWYGDNFIKDVNPTPKACLRNFKIETEMSTTSDEPEWDEVKKNDYEHYISYKRHEKTSN